MLSTKKKLPNVVYKPLQAKKIKFVWLQSWRDESLEIGFY